MNPVSTHAKAPVMWSIAGLDTAGGAGLSADQRAADAMGVHLCPVVACLTAQHSQGVEAIFPVEPAQLEAQLQALSHDLPPRVIKLGLLGHIAAVEVVVRWVDRLRATAPAGTDPHQHLALVVDPVWGPSSGGASFSTEALRDAYRAHLLPRATVVTPNEAEARAWLHAAPGESVPALARSLQDLGARSVIVTGGDAPGDWCLDWLNTPQASGWLCAPRVPTPHHHGTGCTFATGLAAALALRHSEADATVLASQLTRHALMHARAAGQGRGPVIARAGFARGPAHGGAPLPWLGLGTEPPWLLQGGSPTDAPLFQAFEAPPDGLYGILANAPMVEAAAAAGLRCVQLRHKSQLGLHEQLRASLDACAAHGATCFVNDHWREALNHLDQGLKLGLHLGQEDLLALAPADQALLRAQRHRIQLGLSSHSLWELARAAGCGPSLIACGPVLSTTTKDMPWRPQGEDNLRWWVANSPAPVVAIGGLLDAGDLRRFTACGPAAACVVRALGDAPEQVAHRIRPLRQAWQEARADAAAAPLDCIDLPHPVL
jgi:hydroxymethylpyrimidine kinase/phosphomethylpyrimidine kinase/thiamine-phosphate diphosphorylase